MINMRILKPGDEAYLEAFLLPRIESSMFLLGNMRAAGLVDEGGYLQGTYAAAFEQGHIVGVAAHFWNGNLIMQAPLELLKGLWGTAVIASQRPLQGLLGPLAQVQTLKNALRISSAAVKMDESEKLYSLQLSELTAPPKLLSGEWRGRRIQPLDLELMTRWQVGFALEGLGDEDTPELWQKTRASMEKYQKLGRAWVLEDQGEPVATSAFNAITKEAAQVGGVWTPPELRRRGYGRAAVAASLIDACAEGVQTAVLFTGEENIPAQKAYEALGFRHIGDYRILLLHSAG
ncbi:MAG: GNAT family N-acetyltransferase [Chloroflexi bacterium]|nr:GNAT family N-acetyltransferase [Chloroflexota bacterium]